MNSPNSPLASAIISTITTACTSLPAGCGNRAWTNAIKRALIALGTQNGYQVCAAGFPDDCEREWLFDLVWYQNDPPGHLSKLGLVLESEWNWNPSYIKYDFEKLLVARCPLKVMVFQDNNGNLPALWSLLETGIRTFHTHGVNEHYILLAYENAKRTFVHRAITA